MGKNEAGIYTNGELEVIRGCIGEVRAWVGTELPERASAAVSEGRCPSHLFLLWPLAEREPGLFEKLLRDPRAKTFSIYGFFPGVYEGVYQEDSPPEVSWEGRTRGRVGVFRKGD